MNPVNALWDDTIVALATPPGIGAIGVIRVSGPKTFDIINRLYNKKDLNQQPGHTIVVGFLKDNEQKLDEVVMSVFKNPSSYTGEDVIEISCHGSVFVQQQVINAIIKNGGRLARPGEFTQRAFLNGKLDLTQAEAVGDLIASNTEASRNAAINNIRGGFSVILKDLREQLIQFSSLIELELDFSEEDVEFADRTKFINLINTSQKVVKQLSNSFHLGNVIRNGVSVAIVGKPNAGKSTLLNTLLNENRAIVSDIPGTTRDTIEEILNINGVLFRLIDTAGIREHSTDVIENLGVIKSHEKIKEADIVVFVFDVATISDPALLDFLNDLLSENKKVIAVANKIDAVPNTETVFPKHTNLTQVFISAKNHVGIDDLKEGLFASATHEKSITENVIITNARHYESLQKIDGALTEILEGLHSKLSGDLLSTDIHTALHYLGELTGQITNEDRLDYIFSKFCIGK